MGLQNIQFIFDSSNAVFTLGQTISGRILIETSGPVNIRSVKLTFERKYETWWPWSNNVFQAKEKYFKTKITLAAGGDSLHLEFGEHVLRFDICLPQDMPSTFSDDNGRVQCEAILTLVMPWGLNKTIKQLFEVETSPINLDNQLSLAEPKTNEIETFYWSYLRKSVPITFNVRVPYTSFVPGQVIFFTIEIENKSDVVIESIIVKLQKVLKFKGEYISLNTICRPFELATLTLPGVLLNRSSKSWIEKIQIPNDLSLCNLEHCGITSEEYEIKVIANSNLMHTDTEVNVQITMGNVPLIVARIVPELGYPVWYVDHT